MLLGGRMKILVLGAGVVGTAAAYYLAADGHEVTVIERHPAAARGTSQSNAGLVSPGDATAWASPAALKTFVRALWNHDLGIKVRLRFDPYAARLVSERTWHDSQRIRTHSDGSITLQLELGGLEEIERWILSWGAHVRVLEPAVLRNTIRDGAIAIGKLYQ